MSSLSVEPVEHSSELVVSLFEVPLTAEAVAAWIEREHEFRFTAVQTYKADGTPEEHLAVCAPSPHVADLLIMLLVRVSTETLHLDRLGQLVLVCDRFDVEECHVQQLCVTTETRHLDRLGQLGEFEQDSNTGSEL